MRTALPENPGSLFEEVVELRPARLPRRKRRGITIGGLMLAVAGSALLAHHAVVGIHTERKKSCSEHLNQIGIALLKYHDAHGQFPAAAITDRGKRPLLSWRVAILPELGYGDLYDQFHLDEPWDSPHNLPLIAEMPKVFACPSEPRRSGVTPYEVIAGPDGAFSGPKPLFDKARGVDIREVLDGTSNTLMVVETGRPTYWTQPTALDFAEHKPTPHFSSRHPNGFNALFADGSTRFLSAKLSDEFRRILITRDGGEVTGG
ncbi:MAG TPA: DUF1559 domain-containing protein [Isosphaeraceae bacterium]|nr:DUF1559 domain-containing protein [Isosphaeraceae bacterium]